MDVRDGLAGGERLALTPPADLANGSRVKVANPAKDTPGQSDKPS